MMEEEVYKQIERFLSGSMSDAEIAQFKKDMNTNTALKEEVALYQSVNFHLSDKNADDTVFYDTTYRKKIEEYIKNEEGQEIQKNLLNERQKYHSTLTKETSNKRTLYYILSTAAAVVLVFGLLFIRKPEKDLYTDYYKVEELPSFTSRSAKSSVLATAKSNFKNADFDKSLSNFQEYILNNVEGVNPLIYIYTGLIYSEKNDLEKAIYEFQLLEKSDSLDRSRALWYKALIYLKFEKKTEVKMILHQILKDVDNYKYKEAKELLEKL